MPRLVRLYIRNVAIGFCVALAFTIGLVALDVAGLRHLVLEVRGGYLAAAMLTFANGIVFAGVQFAIAVMGLAEDRPRPPRGGLRAALRPHLPAPVRLHTGR
ncbi:MAG: hypothetical protein H5U20_12035 [Rhodobacteraceae bacterium]|nr:hypothetical protein [Paracoccaceae bacterium]